MSTQHCNFVTPSSTLVNCISADIMTSTLPIFVLLAGLAVNCIVATNPVVYKRAATYKWIYNDVRTGSYSDVSIWRPVTLEYGYFALGDVAVATHDEPSESAVFVRDIGENNALAKPTGFREIWNDRGSGGTHDVRIMEMIPPNGYTCLGHVAILGYANFPDKDNYRCVKSQYVTRGTYDKIWMDKGSHAHGDVGLWSNRVSHANVYALDANTYTSCPNYLTPSGTPPLLDSHYVTNHQDINANSRPFTLYETTDMDLIWKDSGSGASLDISVYRARGSSGAFSLGDIAVPGGVPNIGYVIKAHENDLLKPADNFVQVWNDAGSGAYWDGAFYKPLCPAGYRGIGHVAMRNHNVKPSSGSFRCIKSEYTLRGSWTFVWNDRRSGANNDVSVYKAVANGYGQSVAAMSSIQGYIQMNTPAYVLDPSKLNYVVGKRAKKYILTNVEYLFNDRQMINNDPESITRTIAENHGDTVQLFTRIITYSYQETYSWSNSFGLEIGVTLTVTTGVPFIANSQVEISVTTSYDHTWGGSITKTKTDSIRVNLSVLPHSQKSAVVTANRYTMDIPYTATLTTIYVDGSQGTRANFKGVYKGVEVNEIRVISEPDIPLDE